MIYHQFNITHHLTLYLLGRSVPGPPLPRPVLPRERGYLDKFVEFLVGDGPSNRYALICRQCESHNGMALREEFEYIAFRSGILSIPGLIYQYCAVQVLLLLLLEPC